MPPRTAKTKPARRQAGKRMWLPASEVAKPAPRKKAASTKAGSAKRRPAKRKGRDDDFDFDADEVEMKQGDKENVSASAANAARSEPDSNTRRSKRSKTEAKEADAAATSDAPPAAAAAASASSASSSTAAASEVAPSNEASSSDDSGVMYRAAILPGFTPAVLYTGAGVVYVQTVKSYAEYWDRMWLAFCSAGDPDWTPQTNWMCLNTASSDRMLYVLESRLTSDVHRIMQRDPSTAFYRLLCLTLIAKFQSHWYEDQEDTPRINRFMARLGREWKALLDAHTDEQLKLVDLRWPSEPAANRASPRAKVQSMLAEFKREIVDTGEQMAGEPIYKFAWSW